VTRRIGLVSGTLVVLAYIASAALSGHLSPLARRPLLDGLVPPTQYRWVEPPAELAGTNLAPNRQDFPVELGAAKSKTAVLTTDDAQVTLILPEGAFASAPGQRSIRVRIEPLAPSTVDPPAPPLQILGNVYSIGASYRPSGDPAELVLESRVVLVYPAIANVHSAEVLISPQDAGWIAADTNDLPSIQQADAPIQALGLVAVGGTVSSPTPSPGPARTTSKALTIAIVAGLIVLVIGTIIVMWPRALAAQNPPPGSSEANPRGGSDGVRSRRRRGR